MFAQNLLGMPKTQEIWKAIPKLLSKRSFGGFTDFNLCSVSGLFYILLMSSVVRKPTFYICENKDADQLRDDPEADQRLCFRYIHVDI